MTRRLYISRCTSVKQRTISHVSGLVEHEEFIAKVWHAFASVGERQLLIVDRESRSRTMPLRNTSTDCPTCTAVPVDFDFRLPRSLHPDVILPDRIRSRYVNEKILTDTLAFLLGLLFYNYIWKIVFSRENYCVSYHSISEILRIRILYYIRYDCYTKYYLNRLSDEMIENIIFEFKKKKWW